MSNIAITSAREFGEDFIRALSAGVAGAWRERWWTVDLLLVYGAQDLPLSFLINPQGQVVAAAKGARDWGSTQAIEVMGELIAK
jgi:hypothetical protein